MLLNGRIGVTFLKPEKGLNYNDINRLIDY